jgi:predicted N-acyltransferase
MAKQNLRIQRLQGAQITPDIWDAFYDFYIDTTGTPILCTHCRSNCNDDANSFVDMSVGERSMQCVLVLSCCHVPVAASAVVR